jgi:hypothetical protein
MSASGESKGNVVPSFYQFMEKARKGELSPDIVHENPSVKFYIPRLGKSVTLQVLIDSLKNLVQLGYVVSLSYNHLSLHDSIIFSVFVFKDDEPYVYATGDDSVAYETALYVAEEFGLRLLAREPDNPQFLWV